MTTPDLLAPGQLRVFDRFVPPLMPGTYQDFSVAQSVADDTIASVAPSVLPIQIEDPASEPLPADEILAVYPPAGAEDATEVMLPHIALRARSLPWACPPLAGAGTFLAVLLFVDGEASFAATDPTATCTLALLRQILPKKPELELLCHVRELAADDPLAARDDDRFVAIVVGNRLPAADKLCHACLVDLRRLGDNAWSDAPLPPGATAQLDLLHRWSFHTGAGGDYQAYFRRLLTPTAQNPTGGVQAFGQRSDGQPLGDDDGALELAAPLPDQPDRRVLYQGPLSPLPRDLLVPPAASADAALATTLDGSAETVGHAAAFELGRLLALSTPRVLDALLHFRGQQIERDTEIVLHTPLPGTPRPIDFRGDWRDVFTHTDTWFGKVRPDLWSRTGDPTGILGLVGTIPGLAADRLAGLGGLQLKQRLMTLPNPASFPGPGLELPPALPGLGGLDLADPGLGELLSGQFAHLAATVAAIGLHPDEEMP